MIPRLGTELKLSSFQDRRGTMQVRSINFKSFKTLTDFFQRHLYILHGQAFYRLNTNYNLTIQQIADCFGFTKANVNKAINLFLKNQQKSLGSPTQAPSDLGTDKACVPPSDFDDLIAISERGQGSGEVIL